MWDDILGHEQNKEFLARLLQPGNRPHALLFTARKVLVKSSWPCVLLKHSCARSRTNIPAAGANPAV